MASSTRSSHPYFPKDIDLPKYLPNTLNSIQLVSIIGSAFISIILSSWILFQKHWEHISSSNRWIAIWFLVCGILHLSFEGVFVWSFTYLVEYNDILSQLWKEYSLGDSRYLIGDTHVFCLELLSVIIWGPLSLICVKFTLENHPSRLILQTIVSTGHLYGVLIYYSTSLLELWKDAEKSFSRPEFLYFWVYFIGFNIPWLIVPCIIIRKSLIESSFRKETYSQSHSNSKN